MLSPLILFHLDHIQKIWHRRYFENFIYKILNNNQICIENKYLIKIY